jgi:hypothetical protein
MKSEKAPVREKARPLIRCECGFAILLVPDLKAMDRAINAHATEHGKKEIDPEKAAFEEERIRCILIAQALNAAASS